MRKLKLIHNTENQEEMQKNWKVSWHQPKVAGGFCDKCQEYCWVTCYDNVDETETIWVLWKTCQH